MYKICWSGSAQPQRSHCLGGIHKPIQITSASGELDFEGPGHSGRICSESADEVNALENASGTLREITDFGIEQGLDIDVGRESKAFTCAAGNSCVVSSASQPTSRCQNKACSGNENGEGKLHDVCAYKIWQIAGKAGQNRALQMVVLKRYARLSAIEKHHVERTKRPAATFRGIYNSSGYWSTFK
jgi:hypothetical protein